MGAERRGRVLWRDGDSIGLRTRSGDVVVSPAGDARPGDLVDATGDAPVVVRRHEGGDYPAPDSEVARLPRERLDALAARAAVLRCSARLLRPARLPRGGCAGAGAGARPRGAPGRGGRRRRAVADHLARVPDEAAAGGRGRSHLRAVPLLARRRGRPAPPAGVHHAGVVPAVGGAGRGAARHRGARRRERAGDPADDARDPRRSDARPGAALAAAFGGRGDGGVGRRDHSRRRGDGRAGRAPARRRRRCRRGDRVGRSRSTPHS